MRSSNIWLAASLVFTAALIALWYVIVQAGIISAIFLPSPVTTWQALIHELLHGELATRTLMTVGRMLVGWISASVVAIILGTLIGIFPLARAAFDPMLQLI